MFLAVIMLERGYSLDIKLEWIETNRDVFLL